MNIEELKKSVLEQAAKNGKVIDENELNAKILEFSNMDSAELDKLSGGSSSCEFAEPFCYLFYWE